MDSRLREYHPKGDSGGGHRSRYAGTEVWMFSLPWHRARRGRFREVDGCGPKCRALRDQVKFNLNFGVGAGVYWHHGLKGTTVNQAERRPPLPKVDTGGHGSDGGSTTIITQPPARCGGADSGMRRSGCPINPNPPRRPHQPDRGRPTRLAVRGGGRREF